MQSQACSRKERVPSSKTFDRAKMLEVYPQRDPILRLDIRISQISPIVLKAKGEAFVRISESKAGNSSAVRIVGEILDEPGGCRPMIIQAPT